MKLSTRMLLVALLATTAATQVRAQTRMPDESPAIAAKVTTDLSLRCCKVAAGTVIELEVTDSISSKRHKKGDKFGLRLHAPLMLDGVTFLPAGIVGVGEIVHAERARGGGKPGELLLAARYLEHQGTKVSLRGLRLGANGRDNSNTALAVGMAIGVFAHFIHGGEIEIPSGTVAQAKLAYEFVPRVAEAGASDGVPSAATRNSPLAVSTSAPIDAAPSTPPGTPTTTTHEE